MKEISLIGATGSIGRQTLSVVRRLNGQIKIKSMAANRSSEEFLAAVKEFRPEYAALADETAGKKIAGEIPSGVRFSYGEAAALEAACYGDLCVVAATGFAGLKYTLKAIENKKTVALANKETLVCGGDLVMKKAKEAGVEILPVDSEHSAIWQALGLRTDAKFKSLILTASGGPFYGYDAERLKNVTVEEALAHPTWKMGKKVTIDCATLLNKGYEIIEAHHLYNAPYEKIRAIVHPTSIVHSMVEHEDGSVLAQMSYPSMELPVQLALTYPDRAPNAVPSMDFANLPPLRFLPLERKSFPCFDLALRAAEKGGSCPCALNGAGEVAVHAFLNKRIPFTAIAEVIEETLEAEFFAGADCYDSLVETDLKARKRAEKIISK